MPANIDPFEPDYASPPGDILRETLEARAMTQADLAVRSGLSTKHINQIIQGVAPVTSDTALAFERVLGTTAATWTNLEAHYQVIRARRADAAEAGRERAWVESFPLSDLEARGFLTNRRDYELTRQELLRFFGVATRAAWERVWISPEASFHRSRAYKVDDYATACWLRLGEIKAQETDTKPFDAGRFRLALNRVRRSMTTESSKFVPIMTGGCADAGVAVVFTKEVKGSRAQGAVRWLAPGKAVMQLTDRLKREDTFWFTFFHEAAHIVLHGRFDQFVEYGAVSDDEQEQEANRFAMRWLIPDAEAKRLGDLVTEGDIVAFADELRLPPAVVVGRLQHEGMPFNRFNHLRRRLEIIEA
jgi:HTH-type transcriptional regulator / antitoxin HigA